MIHTITAAWVLTLLSGTQPEAPWVDTYPATAEAIAEVANDAPLFDEEDGPARTASYLVAISWFESNHNPRAAGDCRDKNGVRVACTKPGATPHSFCLGQINDTNFEGLGVTRDQLLDDPKVCVRAMRTMAAQSFRLCDRAYPGDIEQSLAWYAAGGPVCVRNAQSTHRVRKGRWLFAHYPVK